ncbi:MAG: hypothetical protein ABF306_07950 [Nocardioides marinisabuli]|uniref:hypothetical protein n=1 Tax=Nocardioides marinisabuli TaxID=419476 RepID=UPI00321ACCA2
MGTTALIAAEPARLAVQPFGMLRRQIVMTSLRGLGLLTLAILLLGSGAVMADSSHGAASPVITRVADPKIPYPTAGVSGRLNLREGCLMIGQGVVFWPPGTSWDDSRREVVFGGDFRASPNAVVDSIFTGGGGTFALEDDLNGVTMADAEAALRECINKTGATHALLAYPERP